MHDFDDVVDRTPEDAEPGDNEHVAAGAGRQRAAEHETRAHAAPANLCGYRTIFLVAERSWGGDRVTLEISGDLHGYEAVASKSRT
jgi:hypothetical protein